MAKAVLVMDMPESCKKCMFCRGLNACKLKKYLVGDRICTIYTVDKQIMEVESRIGARSGNCRRDPIIQSIVTMENSTQVGMPA